MLACSSFFFFTEERGGFNVIWLSLISCKYLQSIFPVAIILFFRLSLIVVIDRLIIVSMIEKIESGINMIKLTNVVYSHCHLKVAKRVL